MEWKPIELTEKEKEWMEGQAFIQNKIANVYATPPEVLYGKPLPTMTVEAKPWVEGQTGMIVESVPPEPTQEQKNLIRGMAVCAEVGRLYQRRGNPPKWTKRVEVEPGKFAWIEDTTWENKPSNRAYRRSIRFTVIQEKQPDQYACGNCNLPFIGPVTGRCQCKPVVLKKQREIERAKELAKRMQEAAREAA